MTHETDREHRKPADDVQPAKPEVTDPPLSNRLTVLADRVGEAFRLGRSKSVEAAQAYLDCGSMLAEAKAECDHGEWIPFLKRAGIPERTAQRMMKLAASGESAETLADKGIKAALAGMVQRGKNDTVTDLEDDPTPTETPDSPSTRRKAIRAERHAEGLCVDCRQPCDGEARCKWCRREFRAAFLKLEAAVLEQAGIEPRVARNMMTLAKADYTGETLHKAGGVNAALAALRRKSGREKTESDSDFPRMEANGLCAGCGQPGVGRARCERCGQAFPATLPKLRAAEELREATGYTPPLFAAVMESFRLRLANTSDYDGCGHFFDLRLDDGKGVWECQLPDTVRRALEEAFPKYFPAPGSGLDGSGSTAGSDANP